MPLGVNDIVVRRLYPSSRRIYTLREVEKVRIDLNYLSNYIYIIYTISVLSKTEKGSS